MEVQQAAFCACRRGARPTNPTCRPGARGVWEACPEPLLCPHTTEQDRAAERARATWPSPPFQPERMGSLCWERPSPLTQEQASASQTQDSLVIHRKQGGVGGMGPGPPSSSPSPFCESGPVSRGPASELTTTTPAPTRCHSSCYSPGTCAHDTVSKATRLRGEQLARGHSAGKCLGQGLHLLSGSAGAHACDHPQLSVPRPPPASWTAGVGGGASPSLHLQVPRGETHLCDLPHSPLPALWLQHPAPWGPALANERPGRHLVEERGWGA